jgi:hypothetical protein
MVLVIEIILAALVHNPDQIVLGGSRVGEYPIDFAEDE